MIRIKFLIWRIGIYYFRWFQLNLEIWKMNQQQIIRFCPCFSDSKAWLLKKSMANIAVNPLADDYRPIFLVAPPCFVAVLIHWLYSSTFYLPQTWCGTGTFHDPSQAETHTHAPAHKHSPPGHTFSIIQFMIIFSTVVNQFQISADTNRLTDKWIHADRIQQSVYVDNHLTHMTHTCTHTIPHPSSTVVAGNDSIHHWRLYEWNKCLCAGWNRLSHISLAWQGTWKVLTASWLWLVRPGVMVTYLWLLCVLCGQMVKTEAHLGAEDWQQQWVKFWVFTPVAASPYTSSTIIKLTFTFLPNSHFHCLVPFTLFAHT